MSARVWLWGALGAIGGCSEYQLDQAPPYMGEGEGKIEVDPLDIDFFTVSPGEVAVREVTIRSVGVSVLLVRDLGLEGAASFSVLSEWAPFELEPGESRVLEVGFAPVDGAQVEATLSVDSNDEESPSVPVSLHGRGLAPELRITPEDWDFGGIGLGCTDRVELILQNVGLEDLTIDSIEGEGGEGWFSLAELPDLPLVLEPGALSSLMVDLDAGAEGSLSNLVRVGSDDPSGDRLATQEATASGAGEATDTFLVEEDPEVDILFAVDRSGSMEDDAASLAASFSAFIEAVGEVTSGWQLGVVTTDAACLNEGILTADSPELATLFSEAVQYGEDADIVDDEALLKLVDRALQQVGGGECNEGLLRANRPLHVVVVSDEPDRSAEQASAWTWDHWLDSYGTYLDNPGLLTVSGVVDLSGCGEGAEGYAEIIEATEGEALDLCSGDWAAHVAALAAASTSFAWTFPLSGEAAEGSITVRVDGVSVADGWRYDEASNAIVFDDRPEGSEVSVSYAVEAICE